MYKRAKQTLLRAIKKARRKSEKNRYPFFIHAVIWEQVGKNEPRHTIYIIIIIISSCVMELFIVFNAKLCSFQNAYQHACFINETKTIRRYNTRIIGIQWRFFIYINIYTVRNRVRTPRTIRILYVLCTNCTYIGTSSRSEITPQSAWIIYHNIILIYIKQLLL